MQYGYKILNCDHEGCNRTDNLTTCYLMNLHTYKQEENGIYCYEHCYEHGFCHLCGHFFAGIDSFDLNNPSHLCDICRDQVKAEMCDEEGYEEVY